jgi:hypothetical protein
VNIGVALHLHSGRRRFVLGGQERRVGPATPLDASPTPLVDARLSASDFDELLRLGGRSAARGPALGEPTRCVLFPNSASIEKMGPFAFRKKQRLTGSLDKPQLFIDVNNDSIRVIDPNSNADNASAAVSRATAAPVTYERPSDDSGYVSIVPAMTLCVPACNRSPLSTSAADWLTLAQTFGLDAQLHDITKDA